jgi:hypothetical protein
VAWDAFQCALTLLCIDAPTKQIVLRSNAAIIAPGKQAFSSMQNFRLCATSVITALTVACGVTRALAIPLTPFRYESQAQRHCPADVVVWLDLHKGIYYSQRQRRYGRGFTGSFVCRKEVRAGGYRRSLLGLR